MSKHARRTHAVLLAVLAGGLLCPAPGWADHKGKPHGKPGGGGGGGTEPPPPTDTGKLVYVLDPTTANSVLELRLLDFDAQSDELLFPDDSGRLLGLAWSHTSDASGRRWIVFRKGWIWEIDSGLWAIREDGTDAHMFLPHPTGDFHAVTMPALSPDDQWLAYILRYTTCCDSELAIQRFDAATGTVVAGSQPIIVTTCPSAPARPFLPVWSPDGTSIAFDSWVPTDSTCHVFRVDLILAGDSVDPVCPIVKMTETVGSGQQPEWSSATLDWPNGRIAFSQWPDLAHMDPDGSDVRTLPSPRFSPWFGPSWSPDASRIAFIQRTKKKGSWTDDFYIISPDESGLVQLTDFESGTSLPSDAWRPAEFVDCNGNGISDLADLACPTCPGRADVPFVDCNANGEHDSVDIAFETSRDCNGNCIPDECDIAAGTSLDGNIDGIPDECQ